jgi:ketosteroid isomerase-like protein
MELARGISQAFETMLGDPKRSKTQRKKIGEVRQLLVQLGVIEASASEVPGSDAEAVGFDAGGGEGPGADVGGGGGDLPPGAVVAAPRARGASEDVTKALFKKLAEASHPDKATDEAERVRRTELMKRLTVAYRTGDLAALVELERALDGEIRGARGNNAQLDATSAAARETVEQYRTVHEFVMRFRDGKMSLDEFLKGPPLGPEDDDDTDEMAELAELVEAGVLAEVFDLLDELAAQRPRRSRRRG